jgi:CCR4-NOT transcription complex subunit 3
MTSRKLQGEIDRVLKRVAEGVDTFETIFEKIQSSSNVAQKEKYELELKKEIKKLQRYRDQIKSWLSLNEIKDKRALTENRKLIEQQMERFKACEKELKTKAYSKEGLQLANKIDPQEKEKADVCNFITTQVETLSSQIDKYESEAEKLQVAIKKSRKGDSSKTERLEEIESRVEKHKHHIMQLEIILRLIENGNLSVEKVNDIRDDIQYYVENHDDDNFMEDDGIYDELNLTKAEYYGFNDDDKGNDSEKNRDDTPLQSPVLSQRDKYDDKKKDVSSPLRSLSSKNSLTNISNRESRNNSITSTKSPTPTSSFASSKPGTPRASFTGTLRGSTDMSSPINTLSVQPRYATVAAASTDSRTNTPIVVTSQNISTTQIKTSEPSSIQQNNENNSNSQNQSKTSLSKQTSYSESLNNKNETTTPTTEAIENKLPPSLSDLEESFEATKARSSKPGNDTMFLQNMLDSSFKYVPRLHDSDEPDFYTMENAYPTPSYYPEEPQKTYENPEIFKKYDVDTLFFIFYYQQGTYQQYLAARELKRQSWRFHKKYYTWFQRLEEPKQITEEYEQGTYIYFDYEGLWCKRKKTEFKFEYCYLEDADLD